MSKKQKHKDLALKRPPTKRQLDKWERQRRWQLIATFASIIVIVGVIILVGTGLYLQELAPRYQPVMKIGDRAINLIDFTNMLAFYARNNPEQASSILGQVIQEIQRNELMVQGAEAMGIKISDKEISEKITELKLDNTPEVRQLIRAQLVNDRLRNDYFGLQVPTSADQQNLEVMFLESVKVYNNVMERLAAGEEFDKLAKEFSFDPGTQHNGGKTGWQPKILMDELVRTDKVWETAANLDKGTISQPVYDALPKYVGYWIIQVTKIDEAGNRQLKGMLLGSEEEAQNIITRLKSGEDFGNLVKEFSQDNESKGKEGELGADFTTKRPALKDAVAKLEMGQISDPIRDDTAQTTGGYWLIKVVDKEKDRQLDPEARNKLIDKAFSQWLEEEKKKIKVEYLMTPEQTNWALTHLPKKRSR